MLDIALGQRQELSKKILGIEQVRCGRKCVSILMQERDHWKSLAQKELVRAGRLNEERAMLSEQLRGKWSKKDDTSNSDIELGYEGEKEKRSRGLRGLRLATTTCDTQDNPLSALQSSGLSRKLDNMTPIERMIVTYGAAVLSSRITRIGFICYCLILHLLVVLSLHTNRCHPSNV